MPLPWMVALLWLAALPPDGGGPRLLIASDRRSPGLMRLYVAAPDGSGARRLTEGEAVEPEGLLSPDGALVACTVADSARNTSDICIVGTDGKGLRRVAAAVGKQQCCSPAWSPDGKRLAYAVLERPARGQAACSLWTIGVDGGEPRRLADGMLPDWSPDGKAIAYTAITPGAGEARPAVRLIAPDGSGDRLLVPDAAMPAWSPDGKRLAVIGVGEQARTNLFTYAADGGDRRQLTALDDPFVCGPQWSPDGKLLYFTDAARPGAGAAEPSIHVYAVAAQGGRPRRITRDGAMNFVGHGSALFLLLAALAGPD